MKEQRYKVIFTGKIQPDCDIQSVKRNLMNSFLNNESVVEKLFSGRRIVIKANIDYQRALAIKKKVELTGALCEIEIIKDHEETARRKKTELVRCPKCGFEQKPSLECHHCGIVFSKFNESKDQKASQQEKNAHIEPLIKDSGKIKGDPRQPSWRPGALFVLTFGIYFPFWFYRTWKHVKTHSNIDVHPLRETLLLFIPIYNFFVLHRLLSIIEEQTQKAKVTSFRANVYFLMMVFPIASFVFIAYLGIEGPYWFIYFLTAFPLARVQKTLNAYWNNRLGAIPIYYLAIGWKLALVFFLFMFAGTEVYIYIWNTSQMKEFRAYTHNEIDSLIISSSSNVSIAGGSKFRDYVIHSKRLMNDRRLYRQNAMVVLKTVLNRFAKTRHQGKKFNAASGGQRLLNRFLQGNNFARKNRHARKISMLAIGTRLSSCEDIAGALPLRERDRATGLDTESASSDMSNKGIIVEPGDDLGTPSISHEYIMAPGTTELLTFSIELNQHTMHSLSRDKEKFGQFDFEMVQCLDYWEKLGASKQLVSTDLIEGSQGRKYLTMSFYITMPDSEWKNTGCETWTYVKSNGTQVSKRFCLKYTFDKDIDGMFHVSGPGLGPR